MEGGIDAMDRLLKSKHIPTAVMCSNDMTAIGVLHKLYRAGLRVPDDLSVIGFDDIHIAQVTIPPLTTIQMSCFELARAAVTALRAHVEEGGDAKTQLQDQHPPGCPRIHRLPQGHDAPPAQAGERCKASLRCPGAKNCTG